MNTGLLNGLMYVPFLGVLIFTCILFFKTGYKRGLYKSLLSLAATIAALLVSMLLAILFAKMISSPLAEVIAAMENEHTGFYNATTAFMVEGVLSVVISLGLFSVFLFIFTIVFKLVSNNFKHELLNKEVKHDQWLGLGVRGLDAILLTFLLVLPLYGTISNYIPVIKAFSVEENPYNEYIDVLAEHPLTKVYEVAPTNLVYQPISKARVGDMKVDVVETVETANELYSMIQKLQTAPDADKVTVISEIADYIDKDVINQTWFYEMAVSGVDEFKNMIYSYNLEPLEKEVADEFFEICNISKKEFQENGKVVIEFIRTAIDCTYGKNNISDPNEIPEFKYAFGKLLNSTKQAVQSKNLVYKYLIYNFLDESQYSKADSILKKITSDKVLDESLYNTDAELFTALMNANNRSEMGKALTIHPSISKKDVKDWINYKEPEGNYNTHIDYDVPVYNNTSTNVSVGTNDGVLTFEMEGQVFYISGFDSKLTEDMIKNGTVDFSKSEVTVDNNGHVHIEYKD